MTLDSKDRRRYFTRSSSCTQKLGSVLGDGICPGQDQGTGSVTGSVRADCICKGTSRAQATAVRARAVRLGANACAGSQSRFCYSYDTKRFDRLGSCWFHLMWSPRTQGNRRRYTSTRYVLTKSKLTYGRMSLAPLTADSYLVTDWPCGTVTSGPESSYVRTFRLISR